MMEATIATGNIVIGTVIEDAFWRALDAIKDLGSEIVNVGSKYESSFAQLETIMNTAEMSTSDMSKGLRDLSKEMGISAGDLAITAYNAISATEDTAGALDLVGAASKLAVAGFSDSQSALSTLTTAMNAYGYTAQDATKISDSLIAVQNMGVTTVEQLSKYMGRAVAGTSLYGTSLADLEKAYIALTKKGISTRISTTDITALFQELGDTGSDVAEILQNRTGKSYSQLAKEGWGIRDVLTEVYKGLGESEDKFANIWGSKSAMAAAGAIIQASEEDWKRWSDGVDAAISGTANTTEKAFATMADTAAFKGAQMEQIINDKFITLYEAIGPYLMELKGQFAGFVESIDVEQVASTLMSVGDAIMNTIDFIKNNAIPMLEKVAPVILGIVTAMATWKAYFGALNLISSVARIASALKGLWAILAANPIVALIALIAGLITYFVTLYQTNEDFRNKVNEVWESVKETITNVVDSIVTFFTETIPNALSSMGEFFANMFNNIMLTFQTWGENVSAFITETIPAWIDSIGAFFDNLPYKIGFALGSAYARFMLWLESLVTWAAEAIPAFIESMMVWFSTLPSRIGGWLTNALNTVIAWGSNLITQGIIAATNFLTNVITVISQLPSRLWTWLVNAANKVVEWGINLAAKGREAITKMKDAIVTAAATLPAKMMEIGRNIVKGVWDGISAMAGWFRSQVTGFFSGIVDGVKSALQIASPSKVFAEIGRYMAEGLGVGWDDQYDSVKKDIEDGLQFDGSDIGTAMTSSNDETSSNGGYTQIVNIYSPEELSPWEVARQTKNATREMLLNFKGV